MRPTRQNATRTTILFPPETTFPDFDTFFSICKDKLRTAYGTSLLPVPRAAPSTKAARCGRQGCPFRVVLEPKQRDLLVTASDCCWEHDHDGALPAETTGDAPTYCEQEDQDESDEHESEEDRPHQKKRKRRAGISTSPVKQLHVPGLPQPGDSFSSLSALKTATCSALISVYGSGVTARPVSSEGRCRLRCNGFGTFSRTQCTFTLRARLDGAGPGCVVINSQDDGQHNHSIGQNLLLGHAPPVRDPAIRAAFGLDKVKLRRQTSRTDTDIEEPASSSSSSKRRKIAVQPNSPEQSPTPDTSTPLASAGLDNFERLTALVLLDSPTLNIFLADLAAMSQRAPVGAQEVERISTVQIKLLAKRLKEAREAGWA
ncbi:hypothetical protein JCM8547_005494 [Rhodosporidiobolus lusitaniae]